MKIIRSTLRYETRRITFQHTTKCYAIIKVVFCSEKITSWGVRQLSFTAQLCHFFDLWIWPYHMTSLSLGFFISNNSDRFADFLDWLKQIVNANIKCLKDRRLNKWQWWLWRWWWVGEGWWEGGWITQHLWNEWINKRMNESVSKLDAWNYCPPSAKSHRRGQRRVRSLWDCNTGFCSGQPQSCEAGIVLKGSPIMSWGDQVPQPEIACSHS